MLNFAEKDKTKVVNIDVDCQLLLFYVEQFPIVAQASCCLDFYKLLSKKLIRAIVPDECYIFN